MAESRIRPGGAGLLFALILAACSRPQEGVFRDVSMEVRPVPVVLHTGDTLTFPGDFRGKWVVLGWIYTHCPDVCPLTAQRFMLLRDSLRTRGIGPDQIQFLLFSFDPDRDSVPRLKAYAESFRADSMFLFGRLEPLALQALARSLGFSFKKLHRAAEGHAGHMGYAFAHDVKVYLVNPQGKVTGIHEGDLVNPIPVDSTLKELTNLLHAGGV